MFAFYFNDIKSKICIVDLYQDLLPPAFPAGREKYHVIGGWDEEGPCLAAGAALTCMSKAAGCASHRTITDMNRLLWLGRLLEAEF